MKRKLTKEDRAFLRENYSGKAYDLALHLIEFDVPREDIVSIMQGSDTITPGAKKRRQQWCAIAISRMEKLLGAERTHEIREGSACCLGGARDEQAKKIFNENATVAERFAAMQNARVIIGGKAWQTEDGAYRVNYWGDVKRPEGGYTCGCLGYVPKDAPMPSAWCVCCGGHIKHHMETALGIPLNCRLIASALTTCGEKSCEFELTPAEQS